MVELSTGTAVAVAAGGGGLLLVAGAVSVLAVRRWRTAARRLASIAARLDGPGGPAADERDVVGRVERLAQSAVLRLSDAGARSERLAAALAAVPAGVVVVDEAGEVVYRNPAGAALAGPGGDAGVAAAVEAALRAAVRGDGGERTVDVVSPRARTLRVSGHPVDDGRRVVGGVVVLEDLTEQRRLDVVRRDFLANVSAELKAPLGALGLLAGTIVAEDDPALTRRLAGRLEADALRVGRLVDDLVDLGRLESEALPVRETVPVHLLVAQAVRRATAGGGTVAVSAAEAPPDVAVVGDRRRLVSALGHLVENAVHAAGAGGGTVRVEVRAGGEWVDLAVRDDGPGITAAELDRVFESFYRTGEGRERAGAGSGLGLAIASRVAAASGGELVVASEEGSGSTFTLRLPAAGAPAAAPAPARREAG